MYAVAINGSPRRQGNTEMLLNKVLEPLIANGWQTECIQLGGQNISGCIACGQCGKNKDMRCAINSDGFNEIFEKLAKCDAMILGSPTYFSDVTAHMKALLDRAGYVALMNKRAFKGKIGAGVVAVRRGGATHAFDSINHMFLMSAMVVPGSLYWNIGYGLNKQDVENDEEGLRNMHQLGMAIDWLGKAIVPVRENYPTK